MKQAYPPVVEDRFPVRGSPDFGLGRCRFTRNNVGFALISCISSVSWLDKEYRSSAQDGNTSGGAGGTAPSSGVNLEGRAPPVPWRGTWMADGITVLRRRRSTALQGGGQGSVLAEGADGTGPSREERLDAFGWEIEPLGMSLPRRKRPARQPVYEMGDRSAIVFVTVCTAGRRRVLANDGVHRLLIESWRCADHWTVGRYVIMPDHVHLFCAPARVEHLPLLRWVAYWKSSVSRSWPSDRNATLWQPGCWDRQLRHGDSYHAKWEYIRNNPVRHGLTATPETWPYQGEIAVLRWHD